MNTAIPRHRTLRVSCVALWRWAAMNLRWATAAAAAVLIGIAGFKAWSPRGAERVRVGF